MVERVEFGETYEFPKEVHNMLVSAQAAHVQLSAMADSKASILMGASFVVFSLTLGQMQANEISPALLVLGADGKGTMTNYRVHNQTYIVDRLFDRARLMLGSGKKAPKVEISREPRG